MRRRATIAAALVLVTALALPGTSSGHPGHAVATVNVGVVAYQPADITVFVGDGINWVFRGPDTNHTITADPGQVETFDSDPGTSTPVHAIDDSYYHDFYGLGTYTYHCKVHPQMHGTVTVKNPVPPAIDDPAVKPDEICTGKGCSPPKLKITVDQFATLFGGIERKKKSDWTEVREVPDTPIVAGRNKVELDTKGLGEGKYRVVVQARDNFNLISPPEKAKFLVAEKGKR